jgi:D-sorbitol dehydrogenase-like protein
MREGRSRAASQRGMTRRELLQGLAALAASGLVPQALAQATLTPAQFSALSGALAGYAYSDRRVAAAMLSALAAAVGAANLARLARLASSTPAPQLGAALKAANLEAASETVIAALYSGTVDTSRGLRVVSYDQALVWLALPWTKPNAFCGGETNYWASAPPPTS